MGFRTSWIARSGASTRELIDASCRNLTGRREDITPIGFSLLELSQSPESPWVVLSASGSAYYSDLDESMAQTLSEEGREILYFWCSDTVMATELFCFKDGAELWSIHYNCDPEAERLEIKGAAPAVVQEVLADLRVQQAAVTNADYIYDITAETGLKLLGFRHDTSLQMTEAYFQELDYPSKPDQSRQSHNRPWWRFWKR